MQEVQSVSWLDNFIKISPILIGFFGVALGWYFNRGTLKEKKMQDERKEIYKKLNSFYGPFQQIRGRSRILYDCFALEYKSRNPDFRTLVALLEGEQFAGNDKALLDRVMKLTEEADQLIVDHSGLVDDPALRKLLQEVGAHWYILRLAYNNELTGQSEHFKDYVFPTKIDDIVEERIESLQQRLDELNS